MLYPALWGSKLYYQLFFNHRKSDRMGLVAKFLDPTILADLDRPPVVIGVTGTNGKTTTTNLLYQLFTRSGYTVACNKGGANLAPGIAMSLIQNTTLANKSKVDVAIVEFDENTAEKLITPLKPDYIVVTNLFTDMMSYAGTVDNSFRHLNAAISPDCTLILNADDLISSQLGTDDNLKVFYSMARLPGEPAVTESLTCDVTVCPRCDHKLVYDFKRYHHIGRAHCPNCGFTNPKADFTLTDADMDAKAVTINGRRYHLVNEGLHNMYNELATVALGETFGLKDVAGVFEDVRLPEIRFIDETVGGHRLISQIAKGENPIAISRAFDSIVKLPGTKEVVICIDDSEIAADDTISEMMGYLYAADLECLADPSVTKVVVGGQHCYDYEVRLLIGGVDSGKMVMVPKETDVWQHLDYRADNIVVTHCVSNEYLMRDVFAKIREQLQRGAQA